MTELWQWSATDLAAAIRAGEISSRELIDDVLDRIDEVNPALNALVAVDHDGARSAADEADRLIGSGAEVGPLHGVPVSIKANLAVEGQPTTSGVVAFADKVATADAPSVRNLRDAGAIVIGRSNLPEFGLRGTTDGPLYGRTVNPWHATAAPGGSSGGAAAAAAAGMGPLHQGSDIGGSLRFPSIACGVASVKPTAHRVPVFNSTSSGDRAPASISASVQGMICREVADVRLATSVMIRPDPRDPNCPPVPWDGPTLDSPITVAVAEPGDLAHTGIVELLERAAAQLAEAGYRVVRVETPSIDEPFDGWFSTLVTEMDGAMTATVERFGSPEVRQLLAWTVQAGEILDRDAYIAALGRRTGLLREWNLFLDEHPLLLTPFMLSPMFDWDFDTKSFEETMWVLERSKYAFGVNYLGLPAGTIGMDLVEDRPAGIQLIGRRFREDLICDGLEAIERANGVMARRLWDRAEVTSAA